MKASLILAGLTTVVSVAAIPQAKGGVTGNIDPSPAQIPRKQLNANVKKGDFRVDCKPDNLKKGYEAASTWSLEEGANYLGGVGGNPARPAWLCDRVSCANSHAIFWCNETPKHKALKTFADIGIAARAIIDKCNKVNEVGLPYTKGAAYHSTGWKVEVRRAHC